MFKLNEYFDIIRIILKCDYIRYPPSEISTTNTANSQLYIYINIPREDSVISLSNSYLELNFDVLHADTNNRYVDGKDIRLVNLSPLALFRNYKLTTSSGKHLEKNDEAHFVSLMYKRLTSSRGSDDLIIGFDRSCDRRQRELTKNKIIKCKHLVRIHLEDTFGIVENQDTATYGLGYNLTLTRNTHNSVLNKANATNSVKIKISATEWSVQHYTVSLEEYNKLLNQIVNKTPTDFHYPERCVFKKEVITQSFWTFELGVQEAISVPIWIYVVFQQKGRHTINV